MKHTRQFPEDKVVEVTEKDNSVKWSIARRKGRYFVEQIKDGDVAIFEHRTSLRRLSLMLRVSEHIVQSWFSDSPCTDASQNEKILEMERIRKSLENLSINIAPASQA